MTIKERRAIAKASGKCGSCRKRYPEPGRVTCEICLSGHGRSGSHVSLVERSAKFHDCCQSHLVHRFDCGARAVKGAAYRRRAA